MVVSDINIDIIDSLYEKYGILIDNKLLKDVSIKIKQYLFFIYNMTENYSSYAIHTTGTKKLAQKIDIYFDDKIKKMKLIKMSLFPWIRIDQLKKQLALNKFQKHLAWNDLRLFYKNLQLIPDNRRFFDFGVQPDSIIVIKSVETKKDIQMGIVNPYHIFDTTPNNIKNLILQVQSGLNNGKKPKLADDGTSGTYFLENHFKKIVAIFKPFDQQPFAENNPRNMVGLTGSPGIRKGILSGESATREVAAFLLDQEKFHGVPETTFVQFFHPTFIQKQQISNPITSNLQQKLNKYNQLKTKHGSLQSFVQSHDIAGNMGSNQFDIQQVHKIGILDIRIVNCDRNDANILVKKVMVGKDKPKKIVKFIPIDHGLSFPDNFQIFDYQLVWMGYRQAKQPFTERSLKFIQNINPIKDCKKLRQRLGFREICLRNFRIAQTFLKRMAKQGFTLYQIGEMMYRKEEDCSDSDQYPILEDKKDKTNDNRSELQKLISNAQNIYFMIKQNGIKSTVNFQIMFTKPKKLQQSLPDLTLHSQQSSQQRQQKKKTSLQKETIKKNHNKQTSITKKSQYSSTNKTRNVSLPNLKLNKRQQQRTTKQKRKMKRKRELEDKRFAKRKKQQWDQEFLDRFVQEKNKKYRVAPSRQRLMSQGIDYHQY